MFLYSQFYTDRSNVFPEPNHQRQVFSSQGSNVVSNFEVSVWPPSVTISHLSLVLNKARTYDKINMRLIIGCVYMCVNNIVNVGAQIA